MGIPPWRLSEMKSIALLLLLVATTTTTTTMASETTAPPGTLYIQGEGSLLVSYDRVKIHVSIRCRSVGINTATLAQTQNQETTSAFMTALEDELGVTKKDLKTEHFNPNPGHFNLNPIRE